jgi:hypothetical protein
MKNLPIILSAFIFLIFISCGSENVTNQNPGTGEEVIFSMDSFAINLENSLAAKDTNITISSASNIEAKFNCSTNADSVNSFVHFRFSVADSSSVLLDTTCDHISQLNRFYSFNCNLAHLSIVKFYIQARSFNNVPCFISLTSISIIKK